MMAWIWTLLLAAGKALIGRFLGAQDERDKERAAGEDLGRAEVVAAGATKELEDAQRAMDASRAAGAVDDTGGVRDARPGDKKWNADDLG